MDEDKEIRDSFTDGGEKIEIEFVDDGEGGTDLENTEAEAEPAVGSDSVEREVSRLQDELEQLREMYLRKLAEFDNYRKRTEKEREELRRTAAEGIIRELLPVVDNFERALQHAGDSDSEAFHQGVEMISRQLWDMLEREGLEAVNPEGEQFEPELHEAVHRVEGTEHQTGTVVSVLAKGYTLSGRLIRPAMVGVAVEPSEPPQPASSGAETEGEGGGSS
jgi:molecular chaperone GrpE